MLSRMPRTIRPLAIQMVADHGACRSLFAAETRPGGLVGNDLDRAEQTNGARFAHKRVIVQGCQGLGQIRPGFAARALDQTFALHDFNVSQCHR